MSLFRKYFYSFTIPCTRLSSKAALLQVVCEKTTLFPNNNYYVIFAQPYKVLKQQ